MLLRFWNALLRKVFNGLILILLGKHSFLRKSHKIFDRPVVSKEQFVFAEGATGFGVRLILDFLRKRLSN